MKAALASQPAKSADFSASSAGILPVENDRANRHSIDVMLSEWSIDISGHYASAINSRKVSEAFLILTMTKHQKESIIASYPEAKGKTFALKEFVCGTQFKYSLDIDDPFGRPLTVYSSCAAEIKEAIDELLKKI